MGEAPCYAHMTDERGQIIEMQPVRIRRVYEARQARPGEARVLVDRIWPRGVAKAKLQLESWPRDLAPSTELRRWFGHDAAILYVGDAEKKDLHIDRERLRELGCAELDHGELPDVIAYSEGRGWLFVIEAVHSFGPISNVRHDRLKALLHRSDAGIVFVTAFADRLSFRKWIKDIAWQTEVWIASEPEHIIHFDGERFLGPYAS